MVCTASKVLGGCLVQVVIIQNPALVQFTQEYYYFEIPFKSHLYIKELRKEYVAKCLFGSGIQ